ncbi:PH domain-containing protein [Alkalilimnicola ehrlichii MLHE-1]|uniref:Membrane-flanked domain protein n=1 Tax=Alkalilimnicola ehrlichii (strain ATCC BAA-1101 / DSM 17681 / MLHE-1) TaxID=187272 RepID=Q0A9I7_ALKEH|nr:PH domain-containing protein [Alkalilimnicola ehrlichii]ABI56500.1 membrane-flanked domain protein [Alkalilimnicola ehrlichii MLHE-1]
MAAELEGPPVGQWQRLSPWALAILFLGGLFRFVRENLPLVVGAGAGAALLEQVGLRELGLGLALVGLIAALISLLYYRRFRFRMDGDVLVVQRGVLERREVKVSAERVQHMALEQPVYMRPFDVVRFSLDTPGGATAEVELPGIRRAVAEALQERLERGRPGPAVEGATGAEAGQPPSEASTETLFRIGPRGLTLHGLASNHAYVIAALLAPVVQPLERLALRNPELLAGLPWLEAAAESPVLALVLTVTALLLLLVCVSVAVVWLRFFGFTLVREGGRYLQYSGLFTRRQQTLTAAKLQSLEWVQTAAGRLLRCGYLVCHQYGALPGGPDTAGQRFLVPGLSRREGRALSEVFWSGLGADAAGRGGTGAPAGGAFEAGYQRVHRLYRRVLALRLVAGATALALVLLTLTGFPGWLALVALALVLAWPVAWLRWRAVAWRRAGRFLCVRRGLLGRRTTLFPLEKVQAVTVQQSWVQRRRGLATLRLQLASGPVVVPFIPLATAHAVANEALYRVVFRPDSALGAEQQPEDQDL